MVRSNSVVSESVFICFFFFQNSAVSGPKGLFVGEALTAVGDCQVTSTEAWRHCILTSMKEPSLGHCLPVQLIGQLNTTPKSGSEKNA